MTTMTTTAMACHLLPMCPHVPAHSRSTAWAQPEAGSSTSLLAPRGVLAAPDSVLRFSHQGAVLPCASGMIAREGAHYCGFPTRMAMVLMEC